MRNAFHGWCSERSGLRIVRRGRGGAREQYTLTVMDNPRIDSSARTASDSLRPHLKSTAAKSSLSPVLWIALVAGLLLLGGAAFIAFLSP